MLSHYRYRVMNASDGWSDGGLDACTDDPAIQPLAVVTRCCYLQKRISVVSICHMEEDTRVTPTFV